jgi:serine/threonine protein phosphatase PrpC/antitoxin component YwqK of YwqJK toxin-antitoxin module
MTRWQAYIQPERQGTSHKKKGNTPCQDKAVFAENDERIAAVLADGVGSLEHSHIAAEAVTSAISKYLLNCDYKLLLADSLQADILEECKRVLFERAQSQNISISQMDCTLLFVVCLKNRPKYFFGQLGDGAICAVKSNRSSLAIVSDDSSQAGSNLTKTVLSTDALDHFKLRIAHDSGIVGLFLTTDGLDNEIYSRAGKVKKNIQWYFNLISNTDESECVSKIRNRWDKLTSDESYGFTDDMSLIAIVQPNTRIELPEDANWLCVCGHRNRMESSRCEKCRKDFLKLYKGIDFKQAGGKLSYFTRINDDRQEELRVLQQHSLYPLAQPDQPYAPLSDLRPEVELNIRGQNLEPNQPTSGVSKKAEEKPGEFVPQPVPVVAGTWKIIKNNWQNLAMVAFLLLGLVLGVFSKMVFDIVKGDSKTTTELFSTQRENEILQSENDSLAGEITSLNTKISETLTELLDIQGENEILQSENDSLAGEIASLNIEISELQETQNINNLLPDEYDYYTFSNGDIYVGQLSQGLPNGTGVVYSLGVLMTGSFQDGLKNGEFYVLYDDGRSEVRTYYQDTLIPNEI